MSRRLTPCMLLLLLVPVVAGGCAAIEDTNPYTRSDLTIRRIAVAPFFVPRAEEQNPLGAKAVGDLTLSVDTAGIMYRQLFGWKVNAFDAIISPQEVLARIMSDSALDLRSPADVVKLGRALGVDAVFIGSISEFNPYNRRPRVAFHAQLFYTRDNMTGPTADWAEADAAGALGDFWKDARTQNFPIFNSRWVYDAKDGDTQDMISRYARRIELPKESAMTPEQMIKSQAMPEYLRFVCWATMEKMYAHEMDRRRVLKEQQQESEKRAKSDNAEDETP